jgi:hypothetical protein
MNIRIQGQQRWQELMQAQVASGLSVEIFCHSQKICRTSFYAWRKRLGKAKGPSAPALPARYEVKGGEAEKLTKGFMRLMPPAAESRGIRIETANGYKVDTGYGGVEGLREVLQVLQVL